MAAMRPTNGDNGSVNFRSTRNVRTAYRWRQRVIQGTKWKGLHDNEWWQHDYFEKQEFVIEGDFWMGGPLS